MISSTRRSHTLLTVLSAVALITVVKVSSFQFVRSAQRRSTIRTSPYEIRTRRHTSTHGSSTTTTTSALFSDIPRDEDMLDPPGSTTTGGNKNKNKDENKDPFNFFMYQEQQRDKPWWGRLIPPPPEDQFIMTGDICVLFFYAFTSHSLNDYIVNSMLQRNDMTILQAVHSLDPMGEVVNTQIPSWVQTQNQLAVDHVLSVNAQETLLNHWGPLFSTEGSACVALCTCWLIAGWLHRAFLFQNSVDCTTDKALSKTFETWVSTCVMMVALAMAANALVEHIPALQTLLCVQCAAAKAVTNGVTGMDGTVDATSGEMLLGTAATTTSSVLALTKADTMFIVDSMSVLIAWRFMANKMLNIFR